MSEPPVPNHERLGVFFLGAVQFVNILDFQFARSHKNVIMFMPSVAVG
ncbi:MAG: hypothetical protein KA258_06180 [Deltaproteobacteria bacterium]|jgi:hypothetical protein|nr:hypothetical protein [Deltaproteobacteria bacterium]